MNEWLYQPATATSSPSTVQPRSAPPSYRSRPNDTRERTSLGQVNAIFNENYASEGCGTNGVTISRMQHISGEERGETTTTSPAVRYRETDTASPKSAGNLGSNIELLAQL